jgi:hypothetical protein
MSTVPTLNGQIIGQAQYATRAVLDRLLARTGTTFHQSVALNVAAAGGGPVDRDQLVARMVGGLKIDESAVQATIAELTAAGLLETLPEARLALTGAGQARHQEIRAGIDEITAQLYGDLPADDLATAARVLTVITARADAALAGA